MEWKVNDYNYNEYSSIIFGMIAGTQYSDRLVCFVMIQDTGEKMIGGYWLCPVLVGISNHAYYALYGREIKIDQLLLCFANKLMMQNIYIWDKK